MEELMSPLGGSAPCDRHLAAYDAWGKGGYGLLITGNVAVDPTHLGTPFDIKLSEGDLDDPAVLESWKRWAKACKVNGTPTIVQLVHAGRQSSRGSGRPLSSPALAPSAVPINTGDDLFNRVLAKAVFGTPAAMSVERVQQTIEQFKRGAIMAHRAGFDGVELHCSHGYLLSQFLSPKTNKRTDNYGGSAKKRLRIVIDILEAIRGAVPTSFAVGAKLNSSDYAKGGLTEEEALEHVRWLAETGKMDFIEVSGGTYEGAEMFRSDKPDKVNNPREAFFAAFSEQAKSVAGPMKIMVTGGLRTRTGMAELLRSGSADLLGLGRPTCIEPDLPRKLLDPSIPDQDARAVRYEIRGTALWRILVPSKLFGAFVKSSR